jgi:glycosyltransferase involved in cell wall biosynthesis
MKVSLCLLVWNELEGCKIDVPQLPKDDFDEMYAIDGGSIDGTVEYLMSQGIPVYRQPKAGLNAAYIHAVERSTCDAVVVFLPKGTIDPLSVLGFRPLLEAGYELIIASRNMRNARNEEDDRILKPRKWAVLLVSRVAAFMWCREGHVVKDILHGFKAFTVAAFKKIAPMDYGLSIDMEMVIRSYKLHVRRMEIPVVEHPRLFGNTHFTIVPTGIKLMKYLWYEYRRND